MENKKDLYAALLEVDYEPVYKESKGQHGKHENLVGLIKEVRRALKPHGLYLEQETQPTENPNIHLLTTRVIHTLTGQSTESRFLLVYENAKNRNHAEAGSQTYHRRYQIKMLLGLCGEEDDTDGSERKDLPKENPAYRPAPPDFLNQKQYDTIIGLLNKYPAKEEGFLEMAGTDRDGLVDMLARDYNKMIQYFDPSKDK